MNSLSRPKNLVTPPMSNKLSVSRKKYEPFYTSFSFYVIMLVLSMASFWGYMCLTNPGCPEYTIIETLKVENFLGRWYEHMTFDSE